MVEQLPFKETVQGSSPCRPTFAMSKKFIIPVIVILLLTLVAVGYFLLKPQSTSKVGDISTTAISPTPATGTVNTSPQSGTFKSFLSFTFPQKCTFSSSADQANTSGTVYLDNGKMRADFSVKAANETTSSHMFVDKSVAYIWMDGQAQGVKIAFDAQSQTTNPQEGTVNPDTGINYICEPWTVDAAYLKTPEKMKFIDLSSQIFPTTLPSGDSEACDACAGITDDQSRNVCLTQLKCR